MYICVNNAETPPPPVSHIHKMPMAMSHKISTNEPHNLQHSDPVQIIFLLYINK